MRFFDRPAPFNSLVTAATLCLCTAISHTQASQIDFSLSDEMIELDYQQGLGSNLTGEVSILHADVDKQVSDILSLGIFVNGKAQAASFQAGGKFFYLDGERVDAHGLALGIDGQYNFTPKLYASASAFYSPNIINGGDFEKYTEADVRLGFSPTSNASIFIGHRHTEASINKFDYEPYQGIMFGFSAKF